MLGKLSRPCCFTYCQTKCGSDGAWVLGLQSCIFVAFCCRVLIFLEAQALGRPPPNYAVHLAEPLLAAAHTLGLRALEVPFAGEPAG